jgi:NADH-quinone oxidoreductase subunit J
VPLDQVVFWVFAPISVGSAIAMLLQRNAVHAALFLVVNFFTIAVFYLVLGASFLFAVQIIVYAGAIMVLFLFVLMLLRVQREERAPGEGKVLKIVAIGLGLLLLAQVGAVVAGLRLPENRPFDASTRTMARELFAPRFVYVFEATSILIVGALVGAVVLARKEQ